MCKRCSSLSCQQSGCSSSPLTGTLKGFGCTDPLECQLQVIAIRTTSYRGKLPGNTLEEEDSNGLVILSTSDQRNAYQEKKKTPLGAKSAVRPYNVFWHLYQVLSVGDPTETASAGPWVACQKIGGSVGTICATEMSENVTCWMGEEQRCRRKEQKSKMEAPQRALTC